MNYQEALEDIKNEHFLEYSNSKGFARRIDTLQKLINEFDMLLDTNNQFEKQNIKLESERNYLVMDNASLIDKNNQLEKALDMLLDLSVDKESGICCTYGCPNKDEDIESGSCVGKCMTKEELKDYIFKKIESGEQ